MNPLKAFVYAALGVPVVATAVSGLDEMASLVTVAADREDFVVQVEKALAQGVVTRSPEQEAVLSRNSWATRTDELLALVQARLGRLVA
jgi:hypothetical protein